jgi:hypothetical protein
MRARSLVVIPALVLAGLGTSCPRVAEAPAPVVVAIAAPAAPMAVPPPPPPVAAAPEEPLFNAVAVGRAAADGSGAEPERPSLAPIALDPVTGTPLPPELGDDEVDEEERDEAAPRPEEPGDRPRLLSTAKETWIFAEPRWKSRRIGYLRAGAVVPRSQRPAGNAGCAGGWFHVEPKGYVCAGNTASLELDGPMARLQGPRPDLGDLPYTYALSRFPPPPLYAHLPSAEEMAEAEPDLRSHLRKHEVTKREASYEPPPPPEPIPEDVASGATLPPFGNQWRSRDALLVERARARSGYALLTTFEHEGRQFGLTTDQSLLPLDRARVVRASRFHGVVLGDEVTLPMAFVRTKHGRRYRDVEGQLEPGAPLAFREAVALTGEVVKRQGTRYLVATSGALLREDQVTVVNRAERPPGWSAGGRKWIDISILRQSLIAYEGERSPCSSRSCPPGPTGSGDPRKTHSTILGAFLIHTKHTSQRPWTGTTVPATSSTSATSPSCSTSPRASRCTRPTGTTSSARPRSHGCVNLAPRDAAWIFAWTTPGRAAGWHAGLSSCKGTLVYTHP